jgi:hypothetical protein
MLTYKKYKTMRNRTYIVAGIIAMIILVFSIRTVIGDTKRETISCTIRNKQVQTRMTGAGGDITTEYRYLVKTDKELFVIENSLINGAYNNSELFMSLDTGKQYTLTVCGWGKSIITEYRNIINIQYDNSNNRQ